MNFFSLTESKVGAKLMKICKLGKNFKKIHKKIKITFFFCKMLLRVVSLILAYPPGPKVAVQH